MPELWENKFALRRVHFAGAHATDVGIDLVQRPYVGAVDELGIGPVHGNIQRVSNHILPAGVVGLEIEIGHRIVLPLDIGGLTR